MKRSLVVMLAAWVAAWASGCGGPCKQVRAEWDAVHAQRVPAAEAHARIQVPYAVANRLITEVVGSDLEVPLQLDKLGMIAPYIASVRAVVRAVALEPAPAGKVRFVVHLEVTDATGLLLALRAHADVAPTIELTGDQPSVTFALRADQLSRLEPELGPRAAELLGTALLARVPADMAARAPRFLVDRIAAKVVEELVDNGYRLLRDTLLTRLDDLTRLRFELPGVPISRIDIASFEDPVPTLELALVTSLPVRTGVATAVPAAEHIMVHIAGSAAAELGNWGIAQGHLPPRYTRKLQPAADGPYVPYFDWRATNALRPLLVHMFALDGGCAHFAVGAKPNVRVSDGKLFANVSNRRLEHAVGPPVLELLANVNGFFQRSVSKTKSAAASTRITVGGRQVSAAVVSAEVTASDLHVGLTLSVATPRAE